VPDFPIDLLERFFHPLFDLLSFLMQVFELSEMFHPRLFLGGSFQFLLERLGDQLAQGKYPVARRLTLRAGTGNREVRGSSS
jgi:hypothetical protein